MMAPPRAGLFAVPVGLREPVWRTAPPPYIAPKPLVLLERQSVRAAAPQHSPQHTARDQTAPDPARTDAALGGQEDARMNP